MGHLRGEYATFITKSNSIKKKCQFCNSDGFFLSFFLVDEGREDPNTTKSGPSSANQRNDI